jgi:hypothetical protein
MIMLPLDKPPDSFAAPDDILQEVWAARKALFESCGHDIDRLFAEARERQRKSGRPSVNLEKKNKEHAV